MAAVGRGELGSADVVRAVFPEEKSPGAGQAPPQGEAQRTKAGSASAS